LSDGFVPTVKWKNLQICKSARRECFEEEI
jgi:hypothetical protein